MMSAQIIPMQPQTSRLAELEHQVERGLQYFEPVAKALREIRDDRLYRPAFQTFEAYCNVRFGMERRQAYRLIDALGVVENLCPIGHISESVVRPLTKLEPEQQREVWDMATERWVKPTAANVAQVIRERFPKSKPDSDQSHATPGDDPGTNLVLKLDTNRLPDVAVALSDCMTLAQLERLHQLIGRRIKSLQQIVKG